jgi:hypothetical protein
VLKSSAIQSLEDSPVKFKFILNDAHLIVLSPGAVGHFKEGDTLFYKVDDIIVATWRAAISGAYRLAGVYYNKPIFDFLEA